MRISNPSDNHKVEEDSEGSGSSPFKLPRGNFISKVWWWYSWPIRFILVCACPNPKTNRRFYIVTFFVCIVFIALNAYFILWMLTIFGELTSIYYYFAGIERIFLFGNRFFFGNTGGCFGSHYIGSWVGYSGSIRMCYFVAKR